jgi:hypothetical protein
MCVPEIRMFLFFPMVHYHLAHGLARSIRGIAHVFTFPGPKVRIHGNTEKAAKLGTGKVLNLFRKSRQCGIIISVRGSL